MALLSSDVSYDLQTWISTSKVALSQANALWLHASNEYMQYTGKFRGEEINSNY
jgi:hypothetical protein